MAKSIADVNFEKELAATYLKGGVTQADLAKKYGMAQGTISRLVKNRMFNILIECDVKTTDSLETIQKKAEVNGKYTTDQLVAIVQVLIRKYGAK